jgi:hypothetical protein
MKNLPQVDRSFPRLQPCQIAESTPRRECQSRPRDLSICSTPPIYSTQFMSFSKTLRILTSLGCHRSQNSLHSLTYRANRREMSETNDNYPAPIHVYEGSDSDSDEYVTSGRAFRDVKEKEMKSETQCSQYEARRRALIRSHNQIQGKESSAWLYKFTFCKWFINLNYFQLHETQLLSIQARDIAKQPNLPTSRWKANFQISGL